jgi:hypothetical protein
MTGARLDACASTDGRGATVQSRPIAIPNPINSDQNSLIVPLVFCLSLISSPLLLLL